MFIVKHWHFFFHFGTNIRYCPNSWHVWGQFLQRLHESIRKITEKASRATGLFHEGGIMKQQTPEAVSAEERMKQFIYVLTSSSKPFLIGHNIQNFDLIL